MRVVALAARRAQLFGDVVAMISLLEPLILVGMGGAVGFIAFSILMPLMSAGTCWTTRLSLRREEI